MAHAISIGSNIHAYDQLDLETSERALFKRASSFLQQRIRKAHGRREVIDKILSFETRERFLYSL